MRNQSVELSISNYGGVLSVVRDRDDEGFVYWTLELTDYDDGGVPDVERISEELALLLIKEIGYT